MAEKKYIELKKPLNVCNMHYQHYLLETYFDKCTVVECVVDDIETIPIADVVEVVRCKDCIHKHELNEYEKKVYQEGCVACTYIHTMSERLVMLPNNFCGYGERVNYESSKTKK